MNGKLYGKYYSLWLMAPALLIYTTFFIIPNISSFVIAFTDWNIMYFNDMRFCGVDNFVKIFSSQVFVTALKNTLYFAVITVVMKNVLGFAMALMVDKNTRYNSYLRSVMFMPVTISSIVVGIIFVAIYNPSDGILNVFLRFVGLSDLAKQWLVDARYAMTAISFMEIWQWSGFNMVVFLAGLGSIPTDYYEAARIDGANSFQQLRYITLPLIVQSINITFMFSAISGLKVFAQVYGTTNGGPADATQVMGTFLYKSFSDGFLGYSSAVGLVFTVGIILVTGAALIMLRSREVEY